MKKKQHDGDILRYLRKIMRIMRLSLFLIIISTAMAFSANSYSQNAKLTMDLNNATVREVIKTIENQSEFLFFYQEKHVDLYRKVTIQINNENVEITLDQLFAGTENIYVINDRQIVIGLAPRKELEKQMLSLKGNVKPVLEQPQQKDITGKVTDTGGFSLPGVSVIVKGTTIGTVTNSDGEFSLNIPLNAETLQFSFVGMKAQEIPVEGRNTFTIVMEEDVFGIDEVVAIGYGTQSKRNITGAVQTVDYSAIAEMPVAQITQKLQGQMAGVQINQYTGMPGSGMKVRIRGQASISTSSDPLYVVDGLPITGDISHINPNEIETITVLKDASSTALYGSRAANGVILITTKNAKVGETKISLSAYYGVQTVPQRGRPDMMNATEFAQFKKESYEDKGLEVPTAFQNPSQYGEGTDWFDVLLQTAPIQDYSVTLSSGSDKSIVTAVVGYFNQEGVMLNSGYERFSLRINSSFNITNWLKTGVNIAPTYATRNGLESDGLFYSSGGKIINNALLAWPMLDYKNPDGTIPPTAYFPVLSSFKSPNWYYTIQNVKNETTDMRLLANAFIEAEIVDGLVFKSTINADWGQGTLDYFTPSFVSHRWASPPPQTNQGRIESDKYYSWLNENTITYNKKFDDHSIILLGGYTTQKYRGESTDLSASKFPDDRVHPMQSAPKANVSASNGSAEWSLISYIARANYDYKGKYLLTASIRRDGSSRFGENNRWGNFPSVAVGWIASDEEFMSGISSLSFLKFRASYGITGNNSIGNYRHLATVSNTNSVVFGSIEASGGAPSSIGDADLGWETTSQLDLGFNLGIFDGRVQVLYDYYTKNTTDLLFQLEVPRESGFSSIWSNVGEIKFWGHEIELATKNLVGDLKWNTNLNLAFSQNEVVALSGLTDRVYGSNTITQVGKPIGQMYGMVWDGVYDNQAEFDNSPKNTHSQVGTIKFANVNDDEVITRGGDDDDRAIVGNPFPKAVFGITNDFFFKNFDLSIVLTGAIGHDIARMPDIGTTNLDGVFNVLTEVKDRWRSESNPGSGKYGKTTAETGPERDWFSSRFVHDGSYMTVRNITLGYTVPVQSNVFKSIRLYTSIQNAFIFTKYDGMNPEVTTQSNGNEASDINQGFDYASYPVPRTITFGLNVNF